MTLADLVLLWADADADVADRGWDSETEAKWDAAKADMLAEARRAHAAEESRPAEPAEAWFPVELSRDEEGDWWYVGLPCGVPDFRISAETPGDARRLAAEYIYNELDGKEDLE